MREIVPGEVFSRRLRVSIPWTLVILRPVLALAFVLGWATGTLGDRFVLGACVAAFWADYFDGALARRWGTVTPALRKADSFCDTAFYLTLAFVTWKRHADELSAHATALKLCLGSLAAWILLDAVRWRQFAGFHAWSAKLFGIGLFAWTLVLYAGAPTGPALPIACALGVASHLEGIAISLTLRRYAADVPTLWHAWKMRGSSPGSG
jgi:CDP-diacylglycerol--glycerol-3-phosphate 3-phosphatidyltransferase